MIGVRTPTPLATKGRKPAPAKPHISQAATAISIIEDIIIMLGGALAGRFCSDLFDLILGEVFKGLRVKRGGVNVRKCRFKLNPGILEEGLSETEKNFF